MITHNITIWLNDNLEINRCTNEQQAQDIKSISGEINFLLDVEDHSTDLEKIAELAWSMQQDDRKPVKNKRSSTVGDIITVNGTHFFVDSIGMVEINEEIYNYIRKNVTWSDGMLGYRYILQKSEAQARGE